MTDSPHAFNKKHQKGHTPGLSLHQPDHLCPSVRHPRRPGPDIRCMRSAQPSTNTQAQPSAHAYDLKHPLRTNIVTVYNVRASHSAASFGLAPMPGVQPKQMDDPPPGGASTREDERK